MKGLGYLLILVLLTIGLVACTTMPAGPPPAEPAEAPAAPEESAVETVEAPAESAEAPEEAAAEEEAPAEAAEAPFKGVTLRISSVADVYASVFRMYEDEIKEKVTETVKGLKEK